jgi:hypothetical protein
MQGEIPHLGKEARKAEAAVAVGMGRSAEKRLAL